MEDKNHVDSTEDLSLLIDDVFDEDGLCISLKKKFLITDSISYKYEFLKSTISNMITATKQEVDAIFDDIFYDINNEYKDNNLYPRTLFGQMEEILMKMDFSVL